MTFIEILNKTFVKCHQTFSFRFCTHIEKLIWNTLLLRMKITSNCDFMKIKHCLKWNSIPIL